MLPIESFGEAERNQRYPSCISMDFDDLKQWRIQHQSENPPGSGSVLPLFVPEPNARISNLSAFSESSSTTTPRLLFSTEAVFSMAQRQELELQALIFKYILAGAAVPVELLQPIKALLNSPSAQSYLYHPYQPYQHFQPHVLQSGYWGRNAVDPEPGRCRRTDGKKWRCSRDVVPGQKYCERHVHRGRNRSRKPVEIPTPAGTAAGGLKTPDSDSVASLPLRSMINRGSFVHSKQSPLIDLTPLNRRSSETKIGNEFPLHAQNIDVGRSEGQLLRHFFDERPKPREESNAAIRQHASPTSSSATGLSISIPRNYSSDFSLKLSTGNIDGPISREGSARVEGQSHRVWGREWAIQQGSSMGGGGGGGGLLAEMLRTSTSNSPTSVLHELRRGCVSETSSLST